MIKLSPSSLSDFKRSPFLFWLKHHKDLELPRGAFPSLPGGMDRVLKAHYDRFRAVKQLPPELEGKVEGVLFEDQGRLKRWRFWKTGLQVEIRPGLLLSGAIDDLIFDPARSLHTILDYKTRGAAWKPGATEEYYGTQADCYDLMLSGNGYPTTGKGYFAYYWPKSEAEVARHDAGGCSFHFEADVVAIETKGARAAELCLKAADCLEGPMPKLDRALELEAFLDSVADLAPATR